MTPFTFEHTHQFSEREYVELVAGIARGRPWGLLRVGTITIFGVLCLTWSYTLLLGVVTLALVGLAFWAPRMLPATAAHRFHGSGWLTRAATFGVSERELWIAGDGISLRVGWRFLKRWRAQGGWLILTCTELPPLYLPIAELHAAGVYGRVMRLATEHAA